MPGCDTHAVAIALDGGFPEGSAGTTADSQRRIVFGRRHDAPDEPAATLTRTYPVDSSAPAADRAMEGMAQVGRVSATGVAAATGRMGQDFSARLIKESFAHVMTNPQISMEYFYSHLFAQAPEIRSFFPLAMNDLQERVFAALARLVWSMDAPESHAAFLRQTALDHRKFGIRDKHHQSFFSALLATVRHFAGPDWTDEAAAAWAGALHDADLIMRDAIGAEAKTQPPWWLGEVVAHDLRTATCAVLTIRPDQPLRYLPGQYVDVQVTRWPRQWRSYSVANAPRPDGLLDLHVRAVRGGMVSSALVHRVGVGECVLLGRARGEMTPPPAGDRDLLCVAGGTGLAPIKAIVESVIASAGSGRARNITLLFGARRQAELYDLPDLMRMQAEYPALSVVPVVSAEPEYGGLRGPLPNVLATRDDVADCEIFVSGPAGLVAATQRVLAGRIEVEHFHHDPPGALSDPR
jgi:NAD(P)H-flavin reductase/hemoglobin-like flavoprotein